MIIYQESKGWYNKTSTNHSSVSKRKRVKRTTSKPSLKRENIKFLEQLGLEVKKSKK